LRLHKGDIKVLRRARRAWRRSDPAVTAAIPARAHAPPGDIRSRAGSVDLSRARRAAPHRSIIAGQLAIC
jgi:hypothetical protein